MRAAVLGILATAAVPGVTEGRVVGDDTCTLPIPLNNVTCQGLLAFESATTEAECNAACCG